MFEVLHVTIGRVSVSGLQIQTCNSRNHDPQASPQVLNQMEQDDKELLYKEVDQQLGVRVLTKEPLINYSDYPTTTCLGFVGICLIYHRSTTTKSSKFGPF